MRLPGTAAALLALALASSGPASAQYAANQYERQYGAPIDVSIEMLLEMPETYRDRAVRTHGILEMRGTDNFALGEAGLHLPILPVQDVAGHFLADARRWLGRDMEVTGVVIQSTDPLFNTPTAAISFWSFLAPQDREPEGRPPAPLATLEDLVTHPGEYDGERVRVVGQFRGANLFGDLPSMSRRRSSDWVLKNDVFAVWVTGEKPQGKGWKLDAKLRRDTGKWMAVEGRVRTVDDVVYILADAVALSGPPTPTARVEKVAPPPPPPLRPPVIVFSLPLDGERDVPPDTVFKVQFSNDMEEDSFLARVGLRYAGRPRPGDGALDAVSMSYDAGRRALVIDPGDLLRAGRMVELLLLPGIIDIDGQRLEPRPGFDPGGAADVLRFQVAGTIASGSAR